ncbi:MAG: putative maturation protein [Alehxovirus pratenecus]|uniref:Maturation protein n=1 Tax=Leviviridae sp. TaxID=2027243 RepID=A0ABY3SV71_9VIRU|nr:MAG: putative maturation protein [Leviviridae sp.]
MSRTRIQESHDCGTRKVVFVGNVWQDGPIASTSERHVCVDVVGNPHGDNTLSIEHFDTSSFSRVNGVTTNPLYSGSIDRNVIPPEVYPIFHNSIATLSLKSDAVVATQMQARSNPGRPGVTPLTLIQDLRDIPRMLRDVGKLARSPRKLLTSREIANQNLAIRFGWLPLIKDLQDVMDLGDTILKRKAELRRLYSSKGLRRRLKLDRGGVQDAFTGNLTFGPHTVGFSCKRMTKGEKWGVCHWKPSVAPSQWPNERDLMNKAIQVSTGMTTAGLFNGAWDLLPWTFLIDWFTDAHDFVLAYNNTVPAQYVPGVIMTHITSECIVTSVPPAGYTGGSGTIVNETKSRTLAPFATVNAFLPNIGMDRLSILSSLFIQRFKR